MRVRFLLVAASAIVGLVLVVSPLTMPATVTARTSSQISAPPARTGQLRPQMVNVSRLPKSASSAHPSLAMPFHPRNPAAFEQTKQLANAGRTPARRSLPTTTLAQPGPAGSLALSQSEQGVANFPVTSYEQQVGDFGRDQEVQPPDTQLAAGPTDLLEMVNDSGSIWTKGGGLVRVFDLNVFFSVPYGYSFTDPRVLYDSLASRWFASGLSFDASDDSQVYVAVSTTSDPTGSWYFYTVESNTSGIIYDQPKLGVSSDKVVISWNDYASNTTFTGQETWVMQKSSMLTGAYTPFYGFGPDTYRFDLVPAQSLTSASTQYLVYDNSDPNLVENQGYPTLGVVEITGTPAFGNVAWNEWDPSIVATAVPPNAAQPSGTPIATNDDRLLSAVWQNGVLWTTGNDYCSATGYSCLRLIQVNVNGATPTVLQDFDVGWSSGYLFYPAVGLDANGDAFFSFSASSPILWASTATTAQAAGDPLGSDEGLFLLRDGLGSYSGGRWGDYSAVAADPVDPVDVWITGEYAASSTDSFDWGTEAAEVTLAAYPTSTPTPTSTATATPTPTLTPIPTLTPAPTFTPISILTPTSTPTSKPTPTYSIYFPVVEKFSAGN